MHMATGENPRLTRRLLRGAGIAVILASATILASCGTTRPDRAAVTGSIPDDYRTRHPITLAEVQHVVDVPIGTNDHKLTSGSRELIRGFAQDYAALSSGTMQVAIPAGAVNSPAANAMRSDVRKVLAEAGIVNGRIVQTTYSPATADASAPIRLSFVAVTAVTGDCGQWPTDLFGPSVIDNTNWENFGCATQQNLAAQIANPNDLVGPRGVTPIDAQRRATVISVYRDG